MTSDNMKRQDCFPKGDSYNRFSLNLNFDELRALEKLDNNRNFYSLAILYSVTFILVFLSIKLTELNYLFFIPLSFLIAGRQGAFLQLIHECSHGLFHEDQKINDFFGQYLLGCVIGVNFKGYRSGHNNHHANTATSEDTPSDSDKFKEVNVKKIELYKLFLKDLLGISALNVFFSYVGVNKKNKNGDKRFSGLFTLLKLSVVQLIVLSLFKFNLLNYFLFWIFPLVSPHMFLMRVRGMAEHGQANQLGCGVESTDAGVFYTRSFLTQNSNYQYSFLNYLEKTLIGSYNVHYHHEHHLFPKVPWYNLKKLSEKINQNIEKKNYSRVYRKGYFSAAFIN